MRNWPVHESATQLPFLRRTLEYFVRRPRYVTAVQLLSGGGAAESDGALLSTACVGLQNLPAGAARAVRDAREHLQRVRVLLLVLRFMARACPQVRARQHR